LNEFLSSLGNATFGREFPHVRANYFRGQPLDDMHEWVVFGNVMKITEAEDLTLSEKRIAI
jgi:hypothetical protein